MITRVVQPHTSHYPNPIYFQAGEKVGVGHEDDEYPGWLWVILPSGNAGWAPKAYIKVGADAAKGITVAAYCARELNVSVGEVVQKQQSLNGWALVKNEQGDVGWVPLACLADS